jgi:hypothetical protein
MTTSGQPGLYTVRYRPVCQAPLADQFDSELFKIATEVHMHMAEVLGAVHALRTETVSSSATKRMHLYFGQLLNDATGATIMLAGHGVRRPLLSMLRSIFEYVARALYFTENSEKAVAHLTDLWNKEKRLFDGVNAKESIKRDIEDSAARVMDAHPDWARPTDVGLKDMLIALYGPDLGASQYKEYHVFYSGIVHGYFDAVPNVIAYVNGGTVIKPGPNVANAVVCLVVRILFTMTCLMKREFGVAVGDTPALYHRFCDVRKRLTRVRNPFPMTRKMLGRA